MDDRQRPFEEVEGFVKPAVDDLGRGALDMGDVDPDLGHVAEAVETADAFLNAQRVGRQVEEDEVVGERQRAGFGADFRADEHAGRLGVFFGEPLDGAVAVRQRHAFVVQGGLGAEVAGEGGGAGEGVEQMRTFCRVRCSPGTRAARPDGGRRRGWRPAGRAVGVEFGGERGDQFGGADSGRASRVGEDFAFGQAFDDRAGIAEQAAAGAEAFEQGRQGALAAVALFGGENGRRPPAPRSVPAGRRSSSGHGSAVGPSSFSASWAPIGGTGVGSPPPSSHAAGAGALPVRSAVAGQ